jgi:hypothetical protein
LIHHRIPRKTAVSNPENKIVESICLGKVSIIVIPEETRQAKFFRIFYKLVILLVGLALLDRSGPIFATDHKPLFWAGFIVYIYVLLIWDDLARSPDGQRWFNSTWIENFTLVWVSILISLICVELFLRTDLSKYHLLGMWPAGTVRDRPVVNSLGFRDEEHAIEKSPGVFRILLLGDSFTAGQGVSETEYYPFLLREQLGSDYEIIVMAKQGIGTFEQLGYLRDYGCAYQPDMVIVGVFSNDPEVPSSPRMPLDANHLANSDPEADNLLLAYAIDYYINRLADALDWRYSYLDWEEDLYDESQPWFAEWQAVVNTLANESRNCGANELYAFTLPAPLDYTDAELLEITSRKYQIVTEVFSEAGFTTHNLFPLYLEEFGDEPYQSLRATPNDFHASPAIHRWYAEKIIAVLEDQ